MSDNDQKKFTILIVDDVPANIQVVAKILKEEGYQLAFAKSGKAALELTEKGEFDLILLDVMMPEIDGFEVCKRFKENPITKDIPVIFLTAKVDTESIVKGFEVGAMDYVTKPFNGTELLARVKTHIELSYSRKELKRNAEKFRYLAVHDDLTNLYNTRYLYQSLSEMILICSACSRPFSLIFMDMDNFKYVVDTYGHLNGSQTLQEVAATIQETIVKPSYGVAYGGDEFVVVLPEFGKKEAIDKAEEIRNQISETVYLSNQGLEVHLSASFGVSTYPDDAENMTELLALADKAMFDIKASGKNAVKSSSKREHVSGKI